MSEDEKKQPKGETGRIIRAGATARLGQMEQKKSAIIPAITTTTSVTPA